MKYFFFLLVLLAVFANTSLSQSGLNSHIDQLKSYVQQREYEKAFHLIDKIKWQLYDLRKTEKEPFVKKNLYFNPYYGFGLSNPIEEWELKEITIKNEITQKKKRTADLLCRIRNPQSPSGYREEVVVSVYDIAHAMDASYVSSLDFDSVGFLKDFAHSQIPSGKTLVESTFQALGQLNGWKVVIEEDAGFGQKVIFLNHVVYQPDGRYILIFNFVMDLKNYSVYQHLFDAIQETIVFSSDPGQMKKVERISFMDIYLKRVKK